MSPVEDYFVTAADDNMGSRICDISTGACVKELEGHEDHVFAVYAQDGVIASADCSGRVIIWSVQAAREEKLVELARFTDSTIKTGYWSPLRRGHTPLPISYREQKCGEELNFVKGSIKFLVEQNE